MRTDSPIRLASARAWRTYTGGSLIDRINGTGDGKDSHFPEDWIMSTVRAINAGREEIVEGLNMIDGTDMTLRDLVAADPAATLGAGHVARWGETCGVLVKVIDAAERLAVQVHPDKPHARAFFNSPFGKTECWHILGGRTIDGEEPCVYMGFKPGITQADWRRCFDEQDIPAMLGWMHRLPARPGDTFLIEGGVPHAIGRGCLLMEIQEPTDFTLRTEKVTPQGLRLSELQCHGGIGFDRMFACFAYEGLSEADVRRRWCPVPRTLAQSAAFTCRELVGPAETPCFTLMRYDIRESCAFPAADGFSGLYVFAGRGRLRSAAGDVPVTPGSQFFVPAACAPFTLAAAPAAPLVIFRALPPAA